MRNDVYTLDPLEVKFDDTYIKFNPLQDRKEYEAKGFKKVKNVEKLQELYAVLDSKGIACTGYFGSKLYIPMLKFKTNDGIKVNFFKVEGHSDNVGNNRADELAVRAKENA